jgi:hypothetical protein
MSEIHIVKQGEHIPQIAKMFGFHNYHIVWDHPENADLKKLRKNPNVLMPGDEVYIPDKEDRIESGATEKKHKFLLDTQPLKLCLVLEDLYEKPIANAPCALGVDGDVFELKTDDKGKIEREISHDAHDAVLVIRGDATPFADFPVNIRIGDLDPVEELSGQIARLNNLGYFPGDGSDAAAFTSAVEEFQCDHPPLKVDGDCGTHTKARLLSVHGC